MERVLRDIFSEMLFLTETQITSGIRYKLKKTIAKTIPPMTMIKVLAGANSRLHCKIESQLKVSLSLIFIFFLKLSV